MSLPVGQCRLCLETALLQRSHYMPAAFYALARGERNPNGLVITPGGAIKTSQQARRHLLCAGCEQRLAANGEQWVSANCWHCEGDFPIYQALQSVTPEHSTHGLKIFRTAGESAIDSARLVYFACSLFWRGAVIDWKLGKYSLERLSLGPYEEGLRPYLLGSSGLPSNVVVLVTVASTDRLTDNAHWTFPYLAHHDARSRQFQARVPGITFQLFTGSAIPSGLRPLCTARGDGAPVCMCTAMDKKHVRGMNTLRARAVSRGDLR
jgi:hypothetical protein